MILKPTLLKKSIPKVIVSHIYSEIIDNWLFIMNDAAFIILEESAFNDM